MEWEYASAYEESFDLLSPGKPCCIALVVYSLNTLLVSSLIVEPCSALAAQVLINAPAHLVRIPDPYSTLSHNK